MKAPIENQGVPSTAAAVDGNAAGKPRDESGHETRTGHGFVPATAKGDGWLDAAIARMLERVRVSLPPVADRPLPCGALRWPTPNPVAGRQYCDGGAHYVGPDVRGNWGVLRRCPVLRREEIRARVDEERLRLAPTLRQLAKHGGATFLGYDGTRDPSAARALYAMRRFAAGRPPSRNVLMAGPSGLGKTRLLLASHFTLLEAGIHSEYVTSPDLRDWFKRADNFEPEIAIEARHRLERIRRAEAVHADDLGHIEGDARARGAFAEGLKTLLDRSACSWATATNRTGEEAEKHPDLSGTIVSRLLLDADVIQMAGSDFRQKTARTA